MFYFRDILSVRMYDTDFPKYSYAFLKKLFSIHSESVSVMVCQLYDTWAEVQSVAKAKEG